MTSDSSGNLPRSNRRSSRRQPARGNVRVECRKGSLGLGRNLALTVLDLSETGARLILSANLDQGQEVEVLILGGYGTAATKLPGQVIWSIPSEKDRFLVGLQFRAGLPYVDLQRLSSPPRSMR